MYGAIENLDYAVGYINPESLLNEIKTNQEIEISKVHIKEKMPVIYYTNILYYSNYNKTLPIGMNVSDKVLIDLSKYNLELKNTESILSNLYIDNDFTENRVKVQKINIKEY